jgi:hypothetical protein
MTPIHVDELNPETRAKVQKQIEGMDSNNTTEANISSETFDDAVKRLAAIQQEITVHSQAWTAGKLEAGQILLDLRKASPHGTWELRLNEICKVTEFSRATAHRYMNAAVKGSVPKQNPTDVQKAKETAQRLQDECKAIGLNVDIAASRESGKFHLTYRNVSEVEIQQAIDGAKKRRTT